MNGRQVSGLIASGLALSLMACTNSPLSISKDPGGKTGGTGPSPTIPSPSPATEFQPPDQPDEPVLDPIPNLNWNLKEGDSPRDQQIGRIHGAFRADGGYKFFLQQGDRFYHRIQSKATSDLQAWSEQRFPSHRGLSPTRLFSDGNTLFFVNDAKDKQIAQDSREERIFQATEDQSLWQQSSLPQGIVAVAGGPGVAFAATKDALYRWNGVAWLGPVVDFKRDSQIGEQIVDISLDLDGATRDLSLLLRATAGTQPYYAKILPAGSSDAGDGYNFLQDADLSFEVLDPPKKLIRSFKDTTLGDYRFWGVSNTDYLLNGAGGSTLSRYHSNLPYSNAFEVPFKGLSMLLGRFYAFRSDPVRGPELFHRRDGITARWDALMAKKRDGSALSVTPDNENSFATDGHRVYLAGAEGLFRYPLVFEGPTEYSKAPGAYAQGVLGWEQESVELNRATVDRVVRCGTQTYVRTTFGTYRQTAQGWVPFELDGRRAMLFSSMYGHAATVSYDNKVDFYLFDAQTSSWNKILKVLPTGALPKADKVFFSKDRLFVAATVNGEEAIYQRSLNVGSDWTQAAPALSGFYPLYVSDGSNLLAVGSNRVKYASLSEYKWKDYPDSLVLPDGKTQTITPLLSLPFAVNGYAFAWINLGGPEYRLCRATSLGWKPVVNNRYGDATVEQLLSTDGHYLYSTATLNGSTTEVVRVSIQDGAAWEPVSANFSGRPLAEAGLKVNGPPFVERESATVYLPTSRGVLGP